MVMTPKLRIAHYIASCAGIGFIPYAPGTCASIVAALVAYGFFFLMNSFFFWMMTAGLIMLSIPVIQMITPVDKVNDPSFIVIDEVIGMFLVCGVIPHSIVTYVLGFLLFRFFDISKWFFIGYLEHIPGPWGIILDDVGAALLAVIFLSFLFI